MHRLAPLALAAVLLLTGCAGGTETPADPPAPGETAAEEAPAPEVEAPADLTGSWKTVDNASEDSWQEVTIDATTIEINWVSDGGDTKALYWLGTFEAPAEAGDYTFTSQADTEALSKSIMGSGDTEKVFTYEGDQLSWEVSAMGVTKKVRAEKQ